MELNTRMTAAVLSHMYFKQQDANFLRYISKTGTRNPRSTELLNPRACSLPALIFQPSAPVI